MTDTQFDKFLSRLLIQFPSLNEWVERHSPDPVETKKLWRQTLSQCELAECLWVLSKWADGGLTPFAAYERDQVAVIIRSVVSRERGRVAAKREQAQIRLAKRAAHGVKQVSGVDTVNQSSLMDGGMRSVYESMRPVHRRMLDGEISKIEYASIFDKAWDAMRAKEESETPKSQEWTG